MKEFRTALLAALGLFISLTDAQSAEFRGLYVDAFHPGFKSHDQVTQMVNAAKSANFNALIVQVRKRGDAYYKSAIEPRAADIAADFDPLADIIAQAHAAGLEVHAWLSMYEVMQDSKWYSPAPNHVYNAHKDWLMTDRAGNTTLDHKKVYLDPGVLAVQDHFVSIITDILAKYAVDGIHLDNIRYPNRASGYADESVSRFNRELRRTGTPDESDEAWCQWRRDQITNLVRRVRDAILSAKPEVKLSASVMPDTGIAGRVFLQEWDIWTRDGLVDFVVPMGYIMGDSMSGLALKLLSSAKERHVYIGIGAYRISPQLAIKHIKDARAAGAIGLVLYSYHYLGPNSPVGSHTRLADLSGSVFAEPADMPQMPWKQ